MDEERPRRRTRKSTTTHADAPPAISASDSLDAPVEVEVTPQVAVPTRTASRRPSVRLLVLGLAGLGVVIVLGLSLTQNAFGAPPAKTSHPYMGSTQGCDAAYWASADHYQSWEEYTPDQLVGKVFVHSGTYAGMTFADALAAQTPGEDAHRTLIRAAVAAALNAANDSIAYPFTRYQAGVDGRPPLVPTTNRLLTVGSADEINEFIAELDASNQLGCPL